MSTHADGKHLAGTSSVPDAELAKAGDASSYLPECINFTARMLESLFADTNTSREFVERGGIEALLAIYALPKLPPTFGSSAPAQALVAAMRSFTSSHADAVSSQLNRVLMTQLQIAVARSKVSAACMDVPSSSHASGPIPAVGMSQSWHVGFCSGAWSCQKCVLALPCFAKFQGQCFKA